MPLGEPQTCAPPMDITGRRRGAGVSRREPVTRVAWGGRRTVLRGHPIHGASGVTRPLRPIEPSTLAGTRGDVAIDPRIREALAKFGFAQNLHTRTPGKDRRPSPPARE